MLYGDDDLDATTRGVLRKLDVSHDGRLSLSEFKLAEKKAPTLLIPTFDMQATLRKKIPVKPSWKHQESVRAAVLPPGRHVRDLLGTGPKGSFRRKTPAKTGGRVAPAVIVKAASDETANDLGQWREARDEKTGRMYYYHNETKERSWTRPNS